jgi:hypothetical protein
MPLHINISSPAFSLRRSHLQPPHHRQNLGLFFWEVLLKLFVPALDLLLLESFAGSCLLHSLVIQVDNSEQIPQEQCIVAGEV